jgi:hypothetical protein
MRARLAIVRSRELEARRDERPCIENHRCGRPALCYSHNIDVLVVVMVAVRGRSIRYIRHNAKYRRNHKSLRKA